ncbi:MAG: hypothetical protein ACI8PB_005345 [Desulforhopalus sp.]|jgi:hypothetical protein
MGKLQRLVSTVASTALMCALVSNGQAEEIAKLKKQLGGAEEKLDTKAGKEELAKLNAGKMVTSKFENIDVSLYGQLNRGFLWSDNGNSSDVYFVENNNSQSRLGLNAIVSPSEDFSIGGKIEFGFSSNSTNDVNQDDRER